MTRTILTLLLAAALAGCATDYPRVDAALGKSQAQMIQAQTLDPAAAANPPALAPAVGDGQRLERVLTEHRRDITQQPAKQIQQTSQFNNGGG